MIETTKAIVLSSIKYGDTSLITNCYTESCGIKSYMLRGVLKAKKAKVKPAYFQPLMQVNLTANHNSRGALNSLRDVEVIHFYNSLYSNIKKQTIALFLAEVLHQSIKEEEQNKTLYKFLETSFLWLDMHDDISNFHLLFLLNLTKYLGFYPELNNVQLLYFDLLEGRFTNNKKENVVTGSDLDQFKKLLGINFDALSEINFSAANRRGVLSVLIQYFELHISGFRKPKSLAILKTIFS